MRKSITDLAENLVLNRQRWGDREAWQSRDQFGYRWGGGVQQTVGGIARFCDLHLRPFVNGYDNRVLELSPGGGRFSVEVIRYAVTLDLLDMNQACLDICRERLAYYPIDVGYFLNDGQSCAVLGDRIYDLIVCFDSMVHMHPDIIDGYVRQLAEHLEPGGTMWLDHSGRGPRDAGHRTDMTPQRMAEFGARAGLSVVSQTFRNDHDCVTVFRAAGVAG